MATKRHRGSIWIKGKKKARGYYVRKSMSGARRFRLKEINGAKTLHNFNAPVNAKQAGWVKQ